MIRFLAFFFLFFPILSFADTTGGTADSAHVFYDKKQYKKAAALYEKIIAANPDDAAACYNLGNTYFHLKQTGYSILNYERALRLAPEDPDIRYNLEFVRSQTDEKSEAVTETLGNAWIDFLQKKGDRFWSFSTLIAIAITGLSFAGYLLSKKTGWRRTFFILSFSGIGVGIFTFIAGWQLHQYTALRYGILVSAKITLYATPSEKSSPVTILKEGAKVEILDSDRIWANVKYGQETTGWIKKTALAEI